MASRFEEPDALACTQCENCGATDGLLRCSNCHAAWFCSLQCHKVCLQSAQTVGGVLFLRELVHGLQSYWPFHKSSCRRNDFADAVEQQEPQFAAWMRQHGKLAVLQDEEVERLERSNKPGGYLGLTRQDVMEHMYGRMDPTPAAPSYDNNRPAHQQEATPATLSAAAAVPLIAADKAWQAIEIPADLGLEGTRHKWWQNLSHVDVFVRLPETVTSKQVSVQLAPGSMSVSVAGDVVLAGQLYAEVKVEDSTWFIDESILQIQLLKRHRKSNYKDGCTAADTFWFSLFAGSKGADRLPLMHPPTKYYSTACEEA